MKKFLLKLFIISFLPLLTVVVYFVKDPFKVLYPHERYYGSGVSQNIVSLNKDFVSTELFLRNYKKYGYDAYIFGNSRSIYYHVSDWKKHIGARHCFHFDATAETLFGIEKKVAFIDKQGGQIKNALFVLDYSILRKATNSHKHLYIKHPAVSGESAIAFQLSFFKDYLDPVFLKQYIYYLVTGRVKTGTNEIRYVTKHTAIVGYDSISNELSYTTLDDGISHNPDSFYSANNHGFYARGQQAKYSEPIIISPLYDQVKLDTNDMKAINEIFGKSNVFDFSGINDITNDCRNYYELSHYRPFVAARLMDIIYASPAERVN